MGSFILKTLLATFPLNVSGPILYQMHQGETMRALTQYLRYAQESGEVDHELLQQAGMRLLEQGAASGDPESEVMSLFGAGVALSPELIPILEKGISSKEVKSQLIALNFLSRIQDDDADQLITQTLSSPFLISRLEAALILAQKHDPHIVEHLEALYVKVIPPIRPLFAQIVAPLESPEATRFLRSLLADEDVEVRMEAVSEAAKADRDELLPQIRSLATHPDHRLQEACAHALGLLKDSRSIPLLKKLSKAKQQSLRLAALSSLYKLNVSDILPQIVDLAKEKDLFAIMLLGEWKVEKDVLASLVTDEDPSVRLNAGLSLLLNGDKRCLSLLETILLPDGRDLGFARSLSPGNALTSWYPVSSLTAHEKKNPRLRAQTRALREKVLRMTVELPEEFFLQVARKVFAANQTPLIPLLVDLLRNHHTPDAIALLKEQQQKAGFPFIRNYCNLALYRLKEEGPYESNLIDFVRSQQKTELIRFRDEESPEKSLSYSLNPEEMSQLLIESFEVLAAAQNKVGIEALIEAIAYGNPKNKYALAGLLIRMTE